MLLALRVAIGLITQWREVRVDSHMNGPELENVAQFIVFFTRKRAASSEYSAHQVRRASSQAPTAKGLEFTSSVYSMTDY